MKQEDEELLAQFIQGRQVPDTKRWRIQTHNRFRVGGGDGAGEDGSMLVDGKTVRAVAFRPRHRNVVILFKGSGWESLTEYLATLGYYRTAIIPASNSSLYCPLPCEACSMAVACNFADDIQRLRTARPRTVEDLTTPLLF